MFSRARRPCIAGRRPAPLFFRQVLKQTAFLRWPRNVKGVKTPAVNIPSPLKIRRLAHNPCSLGSYSTSRFYSIADARPRRVCSAVALRTLPAWKGKERGQFLIMATIGETCSGDTAGGSKNPWKRVTYNTKQQPAGRNVPKLRTDPSPISSPSAAPPRPPNCQTASRYRHSVQGFCWTILSLPFL